MAKPVTAEWMADLTGRIWNLAGECELRFGENAAGTYPNDVEMLLHLAFKAAHQQTESLKETEAMADVIGAGASPRTQAQGETDA